MFIGWPRFPALLEVVIEAIRDITAKELLCMLYSILAYFLASRLWL